METVVITAPAKLNLFLHITGRQPDGYHQLESLVMFGEFGDQLSITPSAVLTLVVEGPFAQSLGKPSNNLVLRAAQALQERAGITQGARMVLTKRIPVSAGLGGGSSDAAAALKGLARLWRIPRHDAALLEIAKQLGSDVPVCLARKPSWISGIGDKVEPVKVKGDVWAVLVNPGRPLSTADVYRRFAGEFMPPTAPLSGLSSPEKLLEAVAPLSNSLEAPAMEKLPVIESILEALAKTSGCRLSRMSGSGATCFGLFIDGDAARKAARKLSRKYPEGWCIATRLGT